MKALYVGALTVLLALPGSAAAEEKSPQVVTLRLGETGVAQVLVSRRGTVLSFPTKPEKVILGSGTGFAIEYVEADLALTPLDRKARSNLFVYLQGRRFTFDLVASDSGGSSIVLVRDEIEEEDHAKRPGR